MKSPIQKKYEKKTFRKIKRLLSEETLSEVMYADVFANAMIGKRIVDAGVSRDGAFYVTLDSNKRIEFEVKGGEIFLSTRKTR